MRVMTFIRATWHNQTCDSTHLYLRQDSLIYVPWRIHRCDLTHWCVWQDSYMHVPWHMCHSKGLLIVRVHISSHHMYTFTLYISTKDRGIFVTHGTYSQPTSCHRDLIVNLRHTTETYHYITNDYTICICAIPHLFSPVAVCCSVLQYIWYQRQLRDLIFNVWCTAYLYQNYFYRVYLIWETTKTTLRTLVYDIGWKLGLCDMGWLRLAGSLKL